jgi:hypothetical protein
VQLGFGRPFCFQFGHGHEHLSRRVLGLEYANLVAVFQLEKHPPWPSPRSPPDGSHFPSPECVSLCIARNKSDAYVLRLITFVRGYVVHVVAACVGCVCMRLVLLSVCALVGTKLAAYVTPTSCMQPLGAVASCVFVRIVRAARACGSQW